jgi:N-acyl-phosphatidylethanolamine-hydrolysing phospholipase D
MFRWKPILMGNTRWNIKISRLLLMFILTVPGGCEAASPHIEGTPYHHVTNGFRNPPGSLIYTGSLKETISGYTDRIMEGITGYAPVLSPDYVLSPEKVRTGRAKIKGKNALTWLGHASFLIHLGGKTILTDPFLTDYATGMPPFGPKRATPPALSIGELPQIDILIVSHNHYDHLDAKTIEALTGKTEIHVIVPLGMGAFFTERGYTLVTELDWYATTEVEGITVTAVPAIHNSGRGLFDRNAALWASYVLENSSKRIYFSSDTAYGPVYSKIGQEIGPVDYALLPIGVYEPRRRMKFNHVNPAEAVRIGLDLRARTIIAMHWGTIRLSDEAFEDPPKRFRQVADKNGYDYETAWILKIGESRILD